MIQDQVTIPQFTIKWSYTILVIGVLVLIGLQVMERNSTAYLREKNKELQTTNENLLETNKTIDTQIKADSIFIVSLSQKIDSLKIQDQKHINQIYQIRKKYEKLKMGYDTATDDVKNDIFTNLINN